MTSMDETKAVLDLLEAQNAMNAYTFWADTDLPAAGYKPADGIGIAFKVRGGIDLDDDSNAVQDPSFQFKIYGASEVACRAAARMLQDNFEGKASKDVMRVTRETLPVTLREPELNWPYDLVFYKVMIRSL